MAENNLQQCQVKEYSAGEVISKVLICNCSNNLNGQIYQQKLPSGKVINTTRIINEIIDWESDLPIHISNTPLLRIDKLEDVIDVFNSLPLRLDNETKQLLHNAAGSVSLSDIYIKVRALGFTEAEICGISWQGIRKLLHKISEGKTAPAAQATNGVDTDPKHSHNDKEPQKATPKDIITMMVALQKFNVSRATLLRAINVDKKITSYRLPNAAENATHRLSEKELAKYYLKR